jgi:TRAP-type mannitol/chloroaromatic compound transport system permease small subunit
MSLYALSTLGDVVARRCCSMSTCLHIAMKWCTLAGVVMMACSLTALQHEGPCMALRCARVWR